MLRKWIHLSLKNWKKKRKEKEEEQLLFWLQLCRMPQLLAALSTA